MANSGRQPFPKLPSFAPPPPFAPPPLPPPPPPGPLYRLRLWHFFLWTFASALIAAVTRRPEYMRELTAADERAYLILTSLYCLIAGPFVATGLWFCFVAMPRRMFFGNWLHSSLGYHPGHWLLLIGGMETLGGLASFHLSSWRPTAGTPQEDFFRVAFIWFPAYLVGLMLAFAAWNRCTKDKTLSTAWSMLYWLAAASRLICCFCNPWFLPLMLLAGRTASLRGAPLLPGDLSILFGGAGALLTVVAALSDRQAGTRRDTIHWLGVAATLCVLLFPFGWLLLLPLRI